MFLNFIVRMADWMFFFVLLLGAVLLLHGAAYLIVEALLLPFYAAGVVATISHVTVKMSWPAWSVQAVFDGALGLYLLAWSVYGWHINAAFALANLVGVAVQVLHVLDEWLRNRKGKGRRIARSNKRVINLGHRLGLGNA